MNWVLNKRVDEALTKSLLYGGNTLTDRANTFLVNPSLNKSDQKKNKQKKKQRSDDPSFL